MGHKYRLLSLLVLALVIPACGRSEAAATPSELQTTTAATTAVAGAGIAGSASISGPKPPVGSYWERYLAVSAKLIVHCMSELGWEATYDLQQGVLLAEVPLSQELERDRAMSFCVAGSHNQHQIYAY